MKIHIVQKGDTLYKIAKGYGVPLEQLIEMNQHLSDPNMLLPGMKIHIPTSAAPAQPSVQKLKQEKEGNKEKKQTTRVEKSETVAENRRPMQQIEMDDNRPTRNRSAVERPIQMAEMPPMSQQNTQMQPIIYCCCCARLHDMQAIEPFRQSLQHEYESMRQPVKRQEQEVKKQEKKTSHSVTRPIRINETYFTNDDSFY